MAELEIEKLTLRFGGLTVLSGVTFAVERAELFALIGPNGAGKACLTASADSILAKGQSAFAERTYPE
jgi:branched-chain amino acid transport system ATP-binding protein